MGCYRCIRTAGRFLWYAFVGALMLAALPAHAASVSFFLDQSNRLPDGPDDPDYLSVTLDEIEGGVKVVVNTLDWFNGIKGDHFGIQKFGFSFDGEAWGEVTGLPPHWRVRENRRMDGFGRFDIRLQGKGKNRMEELSFTVDGVTLGDFDSLMAAQVAGFEWCRIVDRRRNDDDDDDDDRRRSDNDDGRRNDNDDRWRNDDDDRRRNWCEGRNCTTSAYFAGSMPVSQIPVPGALWLFGSGLAGLLGLASRRKRKTTQPFTVTGGTR